MILILTEGHSGNLFLENPTGIDIQGQSVARLAGTVIAKSLLYISIFSPIANAGFDEVGV